MALKLIKALSSGGPTGRGGWIDMGEATAVPGSTVGTSAQLTLGQIAPQGSKGSAGDGQNAEALMAGTPITRLEAPQVAFVTALTAQATLTYTVSVFRANVELGGGPAFGWTAAGGGTPAFSALTSAVMPAIAANTALVTVGQEQYVVLQPGDIVVYRQVTSSGTVVVPASVAQGGVV